MKKIFVLINLIFFSVLFSACDEMMLDNEWVDNSIAISSMDTFISGTVKAPKSTWKDTHNHLKELYDKYHELTDNFKPHGDVKGIHYINELVKTTKEDQTVEIEKELYDLLLIGVELYDLTDGYFDMSIGKIIDIWKKVIGKAEYPGQEVSKEIIDDALEKASEIEVVKDPVILTESDGKYYVTLKYGAKLDLGALAKGYVTQLAADYLVSKGYTTFLISGGGSSMIYGEGNPRTDDGSYRTGFINPQDVIDNQDKLGYRAKNYGVYTHVNYNVTTSGSYNQYIVSEGVMYHHIISPKTKKPENFYLTASIIGDDAGINDGISTAMFNMPPEVLATFTEAHGYEVYTYLFTNTYRSYNQTNHFRELT